MAEPAPPPSTFEHCNRPILHYYYSMAFCKNQWYNVSAVKRPAERGDAFEYCGRPIACARSECSRRDSRALHNHVAGGQVARPQHSTRPERPANLRAGRDGFGCPFPFFRTWRCLPLDFFFARLFSISICS